MLFQDIAGKTDSNSTHHAKVHPAVVDPQADPVLPGCDVMPPAGPQHPPEDAGPVHHPPLHVHLTAPWAPEDPRQ